MDRVACSVVGGCMYYVYMPVFPGRGGEIRGVLEETREVHCERRGAQQVCRMIQHIYRMQAEKEGPATDVHHLKNTSHPLKRRPMSTKIARTTITTTSALRTAA